jgi:hypothetical protein
MRCSGCSRPVPIGATETSRPRLRSTAFSTASSTRPPATCASLGDSRPQLRRRDGASSTCIWLSSRSSSPAGTAIGHALGGTAFFGGAGVVGPLLVLTGYAVVGLGLNQLASVRQARSTGAEPAQLRRAPSAPAVTANAERAAA